MLRSFFSNRILKGLTYSILGLPLLIYLTLSTIFPNLSIIKFVIGIVALFFVPGYLLINELRLDEFKESQIGLSLAFGLVIQTINAYILYIIETFARYNYVDFDIYIVSATVIETILLMPFVKLKIPAFTVHRNWKQIFPLRSSLLFVLFLLTLTGSIYFQSLNNSALKPDGALYCDVARSIINSGKFSSLIVNDGNIYPYTDQVGLLPHVGTPLVLSTFFLIGDASYETAKLGLALLGALFVYLVYEITKLSFDKKAAIISIFIVAIHPLLRYYSGILYGPEMFSAFFTFLSLILIIRAVRRSSFICTILAGVTLFFSNFVWGGDTIALLGTFALILAFSTPAKPLRKRFLILLGTGLPFILLLFGMRLSAHIQLWVAMVASVYVSIAILHLMLRGNYSKHVLIVTTVFIVLTQLYFFRSYLNPQAYISHVNPPTQLLEASILSDTQSIIVRFTDYIWPNLNSYILPIVLISALLSIAWINTKGIIPYFFVFSSILTRLLLLPGTNMMISEDRFYISITIAFIMMSANFFSRILIHPVFSRQVKIRFKIGEKLPTNINISASIITAILLMILLISSYKPYANYVSTFETLSVEENGWQPVIDWIKNNSTKSDVFLTTGSSRLWAWFTNREFVGISVIKNGTLLKNSEIGAKELLDLVHSYNVTYIIFDSTVQAYGAFLNGLSNFYKHYGRETFWLLDYCDQAIALQTVMSSSSKANSGVIVLYKVIGERDQTLFEDNEFRNWKNASGSLNIENENLTVITSNEETWGNYAYLIFEIPLMIPENAFVKVSILNISSPLVMGGIHMKFSDGVEVTRLYTSSGTYVASLSDYGGKSVSYIYLYALLENTVGKHMVSYGPLEIFTIK